MELALEDERGALRLFEPSPGAWALSMPKGDATALVEPLLERARARGITRLTSRQERGEPVLPLLLAAGFEVVDERVEYEARVADLPVEADCPWHWTASGPASLIDRAGVGPAWEEDDDGATILAHHQSSPAEHREARFAWDGETPVAFVLPRVLIASGWGTLSYLGLLPELRGQGLGLHVHRHGFARLRALGAQRYHGGTSASNLPMRRLFERHGCRVLRELVELQLDL